MKTDAKPAKTPRTPVTLQDRVKSQLSAAVLKGKVSTQELQALEGHIKKLQSLLS